MQIDDTGIPKLDRERQGDRHLGDPGFFQGETAVGFALAHRLNFARPVIVHGGYANGGGSAHIGRVGFGVEF
jgi:hypothetical protein